MATNWCIDLISGSATNGGDSWAVDFTSTDGVANGTTTFTSATGGFTGKENRWIYIDGKAVRKKIVTVNSDTSVVLNSTVTAGSGLTFRLGGACLKSADFYTSITESVDTIRIVKSTDKVSIGNATYTQWDKTVTLATARTATILPWVGFPWVASANITAAPGAGGKSGTINGATINFTPASGFATGKMAYTPLYKQFSGGVASQKGTQTSYPPENAAGGAYNETWSDAAGTALPNWWKYDFGAGVQKTITRYAITVDNLAYSPYSWQFQGSNDDTNWTDLDVRATTTMTITVPNWYTCNTATGAYRYYRVYITDNQGTGTTVQIKKIVYYDGVLDLSSFEQFHCWYSIGSNVAAGVYQIKLCSDETGDTAVDTLDVPALSSVSNAVVMSIDKASALGSAIQSIALYAVTDPGTAVPRLSGLIATQASGTSTRIDYNTIFYVSDGTHNIAFNASTIDGTTLYMDDGNAGTGYVTNNVCYVGDSGTFTTYAITPLILSTTSILSNAANGLTISGGWNKTTGLQDGETYLANTYWSGTPIISTTATSLNVSNIGLGRGYVSSGFGSNSTVSFLPCCGGNITMTGDSVTLTCDSIVSGYVGYTGVLGTVTVGAIAPVAISACYTTNGVNGVTFNIGRIGSPTTGLSTIALCIGTYAWGNTYNFNEDICFNGDVLQNTHGNTLNFNNGATVTKRGTNAYGFSSSLNNAHLNVINNLDMTYSGTGSNPTFCYCYSNPTLGAVFNNLKIRGFTKLFTFYGTYPPRQVLIRGLDSDGLEQSWSEFPQPYGVCTDRVSIENFGLDPNDTRVVSNQGTISTNATTRHTASGVSWKISPKVTTCIEVNPLSLNIAELYMSSGITYTVTCYVYRTSTNVNAKLICKGGQLSNYVDIYETAHGSAEGWEQLSIEITPTVTGVKVITLDVWGGTTDSVYVDDMSVSGA